MTKNVFITIDTEHSIGGALRGQDLAPVGNDKRIYGKINNKCYGIPLMIDIADRFGLKLIFFLEVFNFYFFGKSESREVCEYILKRNHEVQLHIHPVYLNFTLHDPSKIEFSDLIGSYALADQVGFLEQGRELLKEYGAPAPVAFRAGSFGASEETLKALSMTGFAVDCSYNATYIGDCCLLPEKACNDAMLWHGIWEYPVTGFQENTGIRKKRNMALDINGVSFPEIRWLLLHAQTFGIHNVTIILHSFNFIRNYDVQYQKVKPRKMAIRRFEKLCAFLAENPGLFHVSTFNQISFKNTPDVSMNSSIPHMPASLSIRRLCEQAIDRL